MSVMKTGKMMKPIAIILAVLMILVAGFATAAPVNADGGTWIYVDGANGSDSNDGSSSGSAVQSWSKAKALLGSKEGGIYVVGTVEAKGSISTAAPDKQTVKRADGFSGVMFEVPAGETATFSNIDVDGEDKAIDAEIVKPNSGSTLNFLSGATFHNVGYDEGSQNLPDNTTGGLVCSLAAGVNILVDGASFADNAGKGIFFTPLLGGTGGGVSNVTLTMKSGRVTGNKGYFYHNEAEGSNNDLRIYNALVRNNNANSVPQRYTNYTDRTGVIYVCDVGSMNLRSLDGAAIYDNSGYDLMTLYEPDQIHFQGTNMGDLNHTMLGGGNPQWSSAIDAGSNYYGFTSNPSQGDKDNGAAAATSIFENNDSALVDSNGKVTFGRYDNETPPVTPSIPEDDNPPADDEGDDNPPADDEGDDNPPADDEGDDNPPADDEGDDNPPADDEGDDNPPADDEGDDNPPADDEGDDNPPEDDEGDDNPPADDEGDDNPPETPSTGDEPSDTPDDTPDTPDDTPDNTPEEPAPNVPGTGTTPSKQTESTPDATTQSKTPSTTAQSERTTTSTQSETPTSKAPRTGDEADIAIWLALAAIAGASLIATTKRAKGN